MMVRCMRAVALISVTFAVLSSVALRGQALPGTPLTEAQNASVDQAITIYETILIPGMKAPGSGFSEAEVKSAELALKSMKEARGLGRLKADKNPKSKHARTHPERKDKRGNESNTPKVGAGGETVTLPPVLVDPPFPSTAPLAVVLMHEGQRLTADQSIMDKDRPLGEWTVAELAKGLASYAGTLMILQLDLRVIDMLIAYYGTEPHVDVTQRTLLEHHREAVMKQIQAATMRALDLTNELSGRE